MIRRMMLNGGATNVRKSLVKVNPNFKHVNNIFPQDIGDRKYQFNCNTTVGMLSWFSDYPIYGISSDKGVLFILARNSRRSDNTLISEATDRDHYRYVGTLNGVAYVTDWSERLYEKIKDCNYPIYEWKE